MEQLYEDGQRNINQCLIFIWISFAISILSLGTANCLGGERADLGLPAVIIHSIFLIISCFMLEKKYSKITLLFIVVRMVFLFIDSNSSVLSNMNDDIGNYYRAGVMLSEDPQIRYIYGGFYSRLLSFLFSLVGPSRLFGAYSNLVISYTTFLYIIKSTQMADIESNAQRKALIVAAFFPYSIYNSIVTYREPVIGLFLILSFYNNLRWFKLGHAPDMIMSLTFVAMASVFHAGTIFLALGYMLLYLFYERQENKFVFMGRSILLFVFFAVIVLYIVNYQSRLFLGKLNNLSENSILAKFNRSNGGSRYLQWINANSIRDVVLFSPLKTIYFLFSPLPTNWRGIIDVLSFLIDSCVYMYLFVSLFRKRNDTYNVFIVSNIIGVIISAFVFGAGTWTAGAAIRHRNKLFSIILVLALISRNGIITNQFGNSDIDDRQALNR